MASYKCGWLVVVYKFMCMYGARLEKIVKETPKAKVLNKLLPLTFTWNDDTFLKMTYAGEREFFSKERPFRNL